jgi:virginiamycin B lyase
MKAALLAATAALLAATAPAHAGGSNDGVSPGIAPVFTGQVSEWAVPTPEFARDPAVAPDGSVFIAVMHGNKIARFDPRSEQFIEWELPPRAHPHGLLVDRDGMVWYTGNGTIGRLDSKTGRVTEFKLPSGGDPHTIVIDEEQKHLWFTVQGGDRVGRPERATGKIMEYPAKGGPYGIALDKAGNVWVCLIRADKLAKIDPRTGALATLDMPPGSRPRRIAASPDGTLWVTLYGAGKLVRIDPSAGRLLQEVRLPAGDNGGPYAVTVDGAGVVWANEIHTDTVVRLDPRTGDLKVVKLPSRGLGIRKMVVDGEGRLWYMGSHNGRLGRVN